MKIAILVLFIIARPSLQAQAGYTINDVAGDFPVNRIINYSAPSSSFQQFKNKLVIVDFFGTWCVPCIKVLPKLSAMQEKFQNEINIILVSDEPLQKLEGFIKKQTSFTLPVVVDESGTFIRLFQPPSYPYTVIVGKNGKIIAIPAQEEVNETNIKKWLSEQDSGPVIGTTNYMDTMSVSSGKDNMKEVEPKTKNKLVQLSQDFMYAAKTGDETAAYISHLQHISLGELKATIKTDDDKKAFWVNLYNAYTQVILKKESGQYKKRGQFFGSKQIEIAGNQFSLDDIEHGILRRSKIKWSLGHLNKLFPNRTEKQLRVSALDYRLHFALNCGAKSCPPIAFYKPETIEQQLDQATKVYLRGEVQYDDANNTVKVPALMGWFRRDFGGKRKMIELLQQLSIVPQDRNPKIKFKDYDWTLYLENYK